jgi:hypothetical protein
MEEGWHNCITKWNFMAWQQPSCAVDTHSIHVSKSQLKVAFETVKDFMVEK